MNVTFTIFRSFLLSLRFLTVSFFSFLYSNHLFCLNYRNSYAFIQYHFNAFFIHISFQDWCKNFLFCKHLRPSLFYKIIQNLDESTFCTEKYRGVGQDKVECCSDSINGSHSNLIYDLSTTVTGIFVFSSTLHHSHKTRKYLIYLCEEK